MTEKGYGSFTFFPHSFNRWSHSEIIINYSIFDQLTISFKLQSFNCWDIIYLQTFTYTFPLVSVGLFTKYHKECTAGLILIESKNGFIFQYQKYLSMWEWELVEILKIHQVKLLHKDRWRKQDAKTWTTMSNVPQSLEYYKLVSTAHNLPLWFTKAHIHWTSLRKDQYVVNKFDLR